MGATWGSSILHFIAAGRAGVMLEYTKSPSSLFQFTSQLLNPKPPTEFLNPKPPTELLNPLKLPHVWGEALELYVAGNCGGVLALLSGKSEC